MNKSPPAHMSRGFCRLPDILKQYESLQRGQLEIAKADPKLLPVILDERLR